MEHVRDMTIRIAVDGAKDAIRGINDINKEADELKTSFAEADKSSSSFFNRLKNGASGINLGGLGRGFVNVGDKVSAFGGKLVSVGAKVSLATAPLALGISNSVGKVMELDTALRKVSTLTDEDILPTEALARNIRKISDEVGISQREIAEGFYEGLSSGIESADITEFVESGTKLTKAGFTDMATVIDATTTVLNAYGDKAYDVAKIHDIFVKTQDAGKITVDELGKSIGRVIPTASVANVNLDQLGAAYSMLTSRGQNANIATTNLNSLIEELSSTGSKADKALRKQVGKSFKDYMADGKNIGDALVEIQKQAQVAGVELQDMFGSATARKAANTIFSADNGDFNAFMDIIGKSKGATDDNLAKLDGPEERLRQAKTRIENNLMEIGENIVPLLETASETVLKFSDGFNDLDDDSKNFIANATLGIVVSGPVMAGLGGAMKLIGPIIKGIGGIIMGAQPATLAIAGIGTVFAGLGYLIYKNWDGIKEWWGDTWDYMKTSATITWDALKTSAKDAVTTIKNYFTGNYTDTRVGAYKPSPYEVGSADILPKLPAHANGLSFVPHDNYLARLHKGERVLTRHEASVYNTNEFNNNKTSESIAPNININVYGSEGMSAVDIAREVKLQLDNTFRDMRLQRA